MTLEEEEEGNTLPGDGWLEITIPQMDIDFSMLYTDRGHKRMCCNICVIGCNLLAVLSLNPPFLFSTQLHLDLILET